MDNLPEWLANVLFAALGGLGAMGLGLLRASVDNNRTRTEDRTEFTRQVMDMLAQERKHYEKRLEARDMIISDLRERIAHLEGLLNDNDRPTRS